MAENSKGIQSLEYAFEILNYFKKSISPVSITELANKMNVSKSKLHKYLTSFLKLGVLTQDKNSLYSIGPTLIEFGLSALNRLDVVSVADPYLISLKNEINQSSGLAIWTEQGPMVIKYYKSDRPISIEIQVGFHAPLLSSSAGKCFAAFLPREKTNKLFEKELSELNISKSEIEKELNTIRIELLSYRDAPYYSIPGSKALASPVFDYSGEIVAAILLIGFSGDIHLNTHSREVILLKETAKKVSSLLSYSERGDA